MQMLFSYDARNMKGFIHNNNSPTVSSKETQAQGRIANYICPKLPIVSVQTVNCICPNCQLYLSKLSYDARNMTTHRLSPVRRHRHMGAKSGEILSPLSPPRLSFSQLLFVQIDHCIFPNCKLYLSKLQIIFVQTAIHICPNCK